MIVIVVSPLSGGRFEARVGDLVICVSRQPLLDGARVLLADYPPETALIMRHAGSNTDALRSTIGAASRLTVEEGDRTGPKLRRWKPYSRGGGQPPIDLNAEEASE
jgi:hypothetical protein